MARKSSYVYVIELAPSVWEVAKFRRANPDHQLGQPCVYVGKTQYDPDVRFDQHMAGIRSNRFVREHGLCLRMDWVEAVNPMTRSDAAYIEVDTAIRLRARGWGVWQA